MPHLTFPLSTAGLVLEVIVGIDGKQMAVLNKAGQPIPAPLRAQALIDTAADLSAVSRGIAGQLGLMSVQPVSTHTAGGQLSVPAYEISLSIFGPQGATGPVLNQPVLLVTELAVQLPGVEMLIGMNLLSQCLLVLDGPGKQFTLAF